MELAWQADANSRSIFLFLLDTVLSRGNPSLSDWSVYNVLSPAETLLDVIHGRRGLRGGCFLYLHTYLVAECSGAT
jgi:hypothetical protein